MVRLYSNSRGAMALITQYITLLCQIVFQHNYTILQELTEYKKNEMFLKAQNMLHNISNAR